ncbi:MAG: SDR family NAD(P)-dependent oxidoreductase [Vicinamibacterales bacterium]|nr:SDR family NAD(P)-dependent oxidoreductase [Vicinamibacterales bacterium]
MDLGLTGKRCVVTGASRGIGLAIARGLAAEGAHVAICARGEGPLREAERELRALGVQVFAEACDVGDGTAVGRFLDAAREALGGVDVCIHNASALARGPDPGSWARSLEVDLMGAVHAFEHVIPWMAASGGGSLLVVSSISGIEASPAPDFAYSAAKAAQLAYVKKLATLHAPNRIRANAVAPGSIDFPGGLWDGVRRENPQMYEMVRGSIPWGRMGTPEEVADLAVYLVSPRAGWVTGECVAVDGGQHRGMR